MASTSNDSSPEQRAVVVGGGPAGALMAVYLSRSGLFSVDVFEALEESKISGPTIRSWNVVLFGRGADALENAGFDLQEEVGACNNACRVKASVLDISKNLSAFFKSQRSMYVHTYMRPICENGTVVVAFQERPGRTVFLSDS